MGLFHDGKRDAYRAQKAASQGATITLTASCGAFVAHFECAKRVAEVLGTRDLLELADGILESVPAYRINTEDLNAALQKIALRFSVSLVDYILDKNGGRFVLLWKIAPTGQLPQPTPSDNLDDY